MKSRPATTALFVSLAAAVAGCGESPNGYVDFDKTAPSSLDQQPVQPQSQQGQPDESQPDNAPDAKSGIEKQQAEVMPVSVAKAPEPTGVDRPFSPGPVATDGSTSVSGLQPDATPSAAGNGEATANQATTAPETAANIDSTAAKTSPNPSSGLVVSAQSGLAGPADNPLVENSASSEPRKIELLIPEKVFRKERGSNAVRLSYDDLDLLKVLNMEPVPADAAGYFPEWLKALDGKAIRIRGFMYPTFEATGLTAFTLARDNGICCFVRQPKIYDIIAVGLAQGVTSDYIEGRPFDVEGVLHIEPQADEKGLFRLYRIDDARVLR